MTLRAAVALAVALGTVACAPPLMKLPSGPGTPTPDAADILSQSMRTCQNIKTISAEIGITGSIGGRRMRARLLVGLAAPSSAYLEAPAPFGAPVFVFAADGDDATLLLPRDRRVLEHGHAAAVLEAIAGVPLGPQGLRAALTGCAEHADNAAGQQLGDLWRRIPGSEEIYLHRERATEPWRLVAVTHRESGSPEWRAEYRDFVDNLPRSVRLTSRPPDRFDLRLSLSQVEVDVQLDPETFKVRIPSGTVPMTLQELRKAGPLGDR